MKTITITVEDFALIQMLATRGDAAAGAVYEKTLQKILEKNGLTLKDFIITCIDVVSKNLKEQFVSKL